MTYNAANRKDVRRIEKQAKLDERARQETVQALMGTVQGRQWIYEHLAECHIFLSSFVADPYTTAFNEGQRSIGLTLLRDVYNRCPDEYLQMMREANVRDISNASAAIAERSRSEDPDWGDQERNESADGAAGDPDSFAEAG